LRFCRQVESPGRFAQKQHLRLAHEGTCDLDPALHALLYAPISLPQNAAFKPTLSSSR
jgi:hypothetical protein